MSDVHYSIQTSQSRLGLWGYTLRIDVRGHAWTSPWVFMPGVSTANEASAEAVDRCRALPSVLEAKHAD